MREVRLWSLLSGLRNYYCFRINISCVESAIRVAVLHPEIVIVSSDQTSDNNVQREL